MTDSPSRLQGINGRLVTRIERIPPKALPERSRLVLLRLAVMTSPSGRAWCSLSRLARGVGFSNARALADAITRASEHPGLLFFVRPEPDAVLPWSGARGSAPDVDAWGFWLPDAALGACAAAALGACAESIREHIATAGKRWPVMGAGLPELVNAPGSIPANDLPADNDLPAEALPERAARARR